MTHLINNWQHSQQIKAIQTTNSFAEHQSFDMHPSHSKPELINQLVKKFNLPHKPKFLQQVHGNQIIEHTEQPKSQLKQQADACFTRIPHVICSILTADCLPVFLTDQTGTFVAAVHCGWRSLYANILSATLSKINSTQPVLAWLGPCIQQSQYEVDKSFVDNYLNRHPNSQIAFTDITKAGKSYASLYTMAYLQLKQLNVQSIESSQVCTFSSPQYYSWRQNSTTKRMASLIWLDS